jgi:hypothetical protein
MVSMMLPSALVELLEELELEVPPRSAIELSMNDKIIDCADSVLVEDVVPAVVWSRYPSGRLSSSEVLQSGSR